MATINTKSIGQKKEEFERIVDAMTQIPVRLNKLKMEKGTPLVVFRDGKIQHIKPEDIQI
jgi:hypothetical protein